MDATINDGGIYTCKAENTLGVIDKEFNVKILGENLNIIHLLVQIFTTVEIYQIINTHSNS